MGEVMLKDLKSRTDFFQQAALANLRYWNKHDALKEMDISILDKEHEGILRAISFGLEVSQDTELVHKLIETFAPYMERRGYWDNWYDVLNKAITITEDRADLASHVTLQGLLARLLQRQFKFQEIASTYRRTIRLARQVGNCYEEARGCTNLGYFYINLGHHYRAKVLNCHALKVFEMLNDIHGLAHTHNHLGILYTRQGLWDRSKQHLQKACELWRSKNDNHGLMRGSIGLSLLYIKMAQSGSVLIEIDKALKHLQEALKQAKLAGEEPETASIYLNMGLAYRLNGDFANAKHYAKKAEKIYNKYANERGLALTQDNLGSIHYHQKQWQEALTYFNVSLVLWHELKHKHKTLDVLLFITECQISQGQIEEAGDSFEKAQNLINQNNKLKQDDELKQRLEKITRSLSEK